MALLSATVGTLSSGLQALQAKPAPLYVLFTASWCPDCTRSADGVQASVKAAGGSLLVVTVADSGSQWKTPAHPLRIDERFRLSGIPTLLSWAEDGTPGEKLGRELESAQTPAAAREIVDAFVAKTSGSQ